MEHLKNKVIDTAKDDFKDFPETLNGMIYIGGNAKEGWLCELSQDEKDKMALEQKIQSAKELLNSTDWYVTRKIETGKDIPTDIQAQREQAREALNGIQ